LVAKRKKKGKKRGGKLGLEVSKKKKQKAEGRKRKKKIEGGKCYQGDSGREYLGEERKK